MDYYCPCNIQKKKSKMPSSQLIPRVHIKSTKKRSNKCQKLGTCTQMQNLFAHTVMSKFQYSFAKHPLHFFFDVNVHFFFMSCSTKKKKKEGVGFGIFWLGRLIFFRAAVVTEDFVSSAARLRRRSNTTSRTPEHSGCLPARTCCQATALRANHKKKKKKKKDSSVKSPLILFPLSKITETSFWKSRVFITRSESAKGQFEVSQTMEVN